MGRFAKASLAVLGVLSLLPACGVLPNNEKKCAAGEHAACDAACKDGKLESCVRQGAMQWAGMGTARNPKAAAARVKSACDKKCLAGCAMLGKFHNNGSGVPFSRDKAKALFKQACDGKDPLGCALHWGEQISMAEAADPKFQPALAAGTKACELGWEEGCLLVVKVHEKSEKLKDHAKSKQMLQDWCQRGSMMACFTIGLNYEYGSSGFEKSPTQSQLMYQKACAGNISTACVSQGEFAEQAPGPAARKAAYLLYKKGCNLEDRKPDSTACKKEAQLGFLLK